MENNLSGSITDMKRLLAGLAVMYLSVSSVLADRIKITLNSSSVTIRPVPCVCTPGFRYGWFHLERSINLSGCASWETIDYYYGQWDDFELKDEHPHSSLSLYRVAFFEEAGPVNGSVNPLTLNPQ